MKAPGKPDVQNDLERSLAMRDYTPAQLGEWAHSLFQYPRISNLLNRRATPLMLPGSLKAAFTPKEMRHFQDGGNDVRAFWELADLSDAVLVRIPYLRRNNLESHDQQPRLFDLSMAVSHMADNDATVFETNPANLVNLHGDSLSEDARTEELKRFITFRLFKACNPAAAHILEIPGYLPDEDLATLQMFTEAIKAADCGHISNFERPQLGHALQSGIARSKAPYPTKPSIIVSDTLGPNGSPITVHSAPGVKVTLRELSDANEESNTRTMPIMQTNTFLVRPMFEAQ